MKLKLSFILLLMLLLSSSAFSQSKFKRANEAFNAGEYIKAVEYYREAYELIVDNNAKAEIIFKIAECFRITNEPKKAELWYKKAIDKNYQNPLVYVNYADALKMNGKIPEAKENYQKFADMIPTDPRGKNGLESCDLIAQWNERPLGYLVSPIKAFNSKASDYSPAIARADSSEVLFTSTRETATGKNIHGATGEKFADIFASRRNNQGKWSTPEPVPGINTEFEEGTPNLTKDYNTLYFSVCKQNKNKSQGCQIFTAKRTGEEWSSPEKVEFGPDSITYAHPAISPDDLILYFVSDMPGTLGGTDIWKVTRESASSKWGTPENLGPGINTPGVENFPFVHKDGTLYFSSNGHPGLGGLDIFRARLTPDGNWKAENMGVPINSAADDFGITFEQDFERGFFSSTRAKGDDEIYFFVLPPLKFDMIVAVKDGKTKQNLGGSTVKAIGSDGTTQIVTTGPDGVAKFDMRANTDYVFVASSQGFLNGKERETTKGLDKSNEFSSSILLTSISRPIELPNIFYDFGKWDLRPESMVSLDKLVETLNDNPTITIELGSHTDNRGSDKANAELSQKRAQSVVNYLVEKGITVDRLTAKGYGESMPREVDEAMHAQYDFLPLASKLSEDFIKNITAVEQQEIAHQLNRRTEFRVLRTDYVPKAK